VIAVAAAQTAACHACAISQARTSIRQWRGIMTDTTATSVPSHIGQDRKLRDDELDAVAGLRCPEDFLLDIFM